MAFFVRASAVISLGIFVEISAGGVGRETSEFPRGWMPKVTDELHVESRKGVAYINGRLTINLALLLVWTDIPLINPLSQRDH